MNLVTGRRCQGLSLTGKSPTLLEESGGGDGGGGVVEGGGGAVRKTHQFSGFPSFYHVADIPFQYRH